jgi:ankyrin repeat protein
MMATRFGKLDAARLLIGEGADLTLKNDLGMTALDFAKESQHGDLTELLQQSLVLRKSKSTSLIFVSYCSDCSAAYCLFTKLCVKVRTSNFGVNSVDSYSCRSPIELNLAM